jgi:hypothetical protein
LEAPAASATPGASIAPPNDIAEATPNAAQIAAERVWNLKEESTSMAVVSDLDHEELDYDRAPPVVVTPLPGPLD